MCVCMCVCVCMHACMHVCAFLGESPGLDAAPTHPVPRAVQPSWPPHACAQCMAVGSQHQALGLRLCEKTFGGGVSVLQPVAASSQHGTVYDTIVMQLPCECRWLHRKRTGMHIAGHPGTHTPGETHTHTVTHTHTHTPSLLRTRTHSPGGRWVAHPQVHAAVVQYDPWTIAPTLQTHNQYYTGGGGGSQGLRFTTCGVP